jgi:hypothetical protein
MLGWEYLVGQDALSSDEHQSGGEIRGNYVASVALLLIEVIE